jgi:hypothetical protein
LDVSIGTQSLMHPVDWLSVNTNQNIQQSLPEDEQGANVSAWFHRNDLSFLQTPVPQKSRSRISSIPESDEEDTVEAQYVVHNVATDISFDLHTLIDLAALRERVLAAVPNAPPSPSVAQTPARKGLDEWVPFSSIKKEVVSIPRGQSKLSLERTKRSLFAGGGGGGGIDAHRFSLDDDDDDESEDDDYENEPPLVL